MMITSLPSREDVEVIWPCVVKSYLQLGFVVEDVKSIVSNHEAAILPVASKARASLMYRDPVHPVRTQQEAWVCAYRSLDRYAGSLHHSMKPLKKLEGKSVNSLKN